MPVRFYHDPGHVLDIGIRNVCLEKVAHGIDEDGARAGPVKRFDELGGDESRVKPQFVGVARHATEALGKGLRVAVFTAWANLDVAAHRIPRGVGPFDLAVIAHCRASLSWLP